MKILQISPQVSLPADSGGRISIWGITKYLSDRGNELHFVAYNRASMEPAYKRQLDEVCRSYLFKADLDNGVLSAFLNLFSGVPYNIWKYETKTFKKFLNKFFKENKVDLVHIDHLHMAWTVDFIRELSNAPVVLREHNLEMKIMQRFYERQSNFIIKKYAELQYKKFVKYEPTTAGKFDKCIMISGHDEKVLKGLNPSADTVTIPVGVDESLLKINKKDIIPYSIFHLGALDWLPNLDGLNWYLSDVFPNVVAKIPEVKLFIYGKGAKELKLAPELKDNVVCVGYVKDLWAEILNKQLAIVPLKVGSGIRVKILEMLATGQNILTTSIGKEGIDASDGDELLIADTSDSFVEKTLAYFNREYDTNQMSLNAKSLIQKKYTWPAIAERFEAEYKKLITRKM